MDAVILEHKQWHIQNRNHANALPAYTLPHTFSADCICLTTNRFALSSVDTIDGAEGSQCLAVLGAARPSVASGATQLAGAREGEPLKRTAEPGKRTHRSTDRKHGKRTITIRWKQRVERPLEKMVPCIPGVPVNTASHYPSFSDLSQFNDTQYTCWRKEMLEFVWYVSQK